MKEFYRAKETAPMDCERLSHVVSCPNCLDEINTMLKLAPLTERYPTDSIGKDTSGKGGPGGEGGGGSGSGDPQNAVRKYRRRAREAFEHRPQELCVSVNGYIQGAHKIASEVSELDLSANLEEVVSFVEVFSEQGIRLLMLNAQEPPPHGSDIQTSRAELSNGRTLELTLKFRSSWPNLHLVYCDPTFKAVDAIDLTALEQGTAEQATVPSQDLPLLRSAIAAERAPLSARLVDPLTRLTRLVTRLVKRVFNSNLLLRPASVTALIAFLLITAVCVHSPAPCSDSGCFCRCATLSVRDFGRCDRGTNGSSAASHHQSRGEKL